MDYLHFVPQSQRHLEWALQSIVLSEGNKQPKSTYEAWSVFTLRWPGGASGNATKVKLPRSFLGLGFKPHMLLILKGQWKVLTAQEAAMKVFAHAWSNIKEFYGWGVTTRWGTLLKGLSIKKEEDRCLSDWEPLIKQMKEQMEVFITFSVTVTHFSPKPEHSLLAVGTPSEQRLAWKRVETTFFRHRD